MTKALLYSTKKENDKAERMKVIDLRPPPAWSESHRTKLSLFYKILKIFHYFLKKHFVM